MSIKMLTEKLSSGFEVTKIKTDTTRACFPNSWCNQPPPPTKIGLISINIFLALLIICLKLVDVISHPIVIIRFQFYSQLGSDAQSPGVVVHMVPHEGGDHVVGVVVQRLHPQLARVAYSCCCVGEVLRFQLVV